MNRVLKPSRRDVMRLAGGAAMAGLPFAGHVPVWSQAACAVIGSPSLTEGPYFVDEDLNRGDLRYDPSDGSLQPGMPLSLAIQVQQKVDCGTAPMTGAYVDIWHCNAVGVYSDIAAQNVVGKKFLRGYQPTDRQGNAYFITIYPGWYQGRSVHIHVKVRIFTLGAESYEFTSQFFFDETFTDKVYQASNAYNPRMRDTLNSTDGIYNGASSTGTIQSGAGNNLLLTLRQKSSWVEADAKLICDLSLGSSPDQTPGGGGPGGPGGGIPPGGGGMPPGGGFPPGGTPPGGGNV